MARQFFVTAEAINAERVSLPPELAAHIGSVLRLPPGEEIVLLDGRGNHYRCRLTTIGKGGGEAQILEQWHAGERAIPLRLVQGLPKGDKLDLILQKGTELGVSRFSPVWSERSIPAPARESRKLQRWQKIVSEAARQSRRPVLPACDPPAALRDLLARHEDGLKLMLWEEGSRPLQAALPENAPTAITLLVGPEGGFSTDEAELAQAAGFIPVSLGPRILRTETAGFAVCAVLQYLYGDFGVR